MNYFRSNNNSLKYQRLTPSGCKDIAIWKSEFVAKTQFLCFRYFTSEIFIKKSIYIYIYPSPGLPCVLTETNSEFNHVYTSCEQFDYFPQTLQF